jgi:release factor glutamine methyltransferase
MDTDALVTRLRAAGCVFAEDEAALLLAAGGDVDALVERRVAGEPLEQVLGWAEFCGLRFAVEPGVFVPRQRSRLLVREAAGRAAPGAVVLDLCCGTGAVGAAVAAAVPGVELHAADVDPAAVRCARRNVPGQVYEGDLYDALPAALRGRVDVLVCNAPYVPTGAIALMPPEARDHERRAALDGGADGVAVQRRVAAGAPGWLAPGGWLLVETSDRQAQVTRAAFTAAGLRAEVVADEELAGTVVLGRLPA